MPEKYRVIVLLSINTVYRIDSATVLSSATSRNRSFILKMNKNHECRIIGDVAGELFIIYY